MTMSKLDRLQRLDLLGVSAPCAEAAPSAVAMDGDESPWGWSSQWQAAMLEGWRQAAWHRRPTSERAVRRLVASANDLDADWVTLGAGHHALLADVLKAWAIRGTVLYPTPTDPMYGIVTHGLGITAVGVLSEADFTLDAAQIVLSCARHQACAVILGHPNNPTGHAPSPNELLQIVEACDALVIVDETHLLDQRRSVVFAVTQYDNLVVLKNASPSHPMAAWPLAWAIGHPRVMAEVAKVQIPHTIAEGSLLCARYWFEQKQPDDAVVMAIATERQRVCQAMTGIRGVVTWPSVAPFILVGTTWSGEELASRLLEFGIKVRAFSRSPLMNCIRVTIAHPSENDALLAALEKLFGLVTPNELLFP